MPSWVNPGTLRKEMQENSTFYKSQSIGYTGIPDAHTNPLQAYRYIVARRNFQIRANKQKPLIRIWDASHNYIGKITGEVEAEWEELMYSAGTATVTIGRSNWLADFLIKDVRAEEDLHITIDPRPTKRSWRTRWNGKVTEAHVKRTSEGLHLVTLNCIHNWEHWNHLCFRANPVLPPEIQFPKIFMMAMNTRSAINVTGTLNLARQYVPLLSILDNIFNPTHWLTLLTDIGRDPISSLFNFNPLGWPVQMEYINPIIDQSRFTFIVSRKTMANAATEPALRDAGCFMKPVLFILGEDTDSPHEELQDLIGQYAMPVRTSIVFKCLNKSGVTGPTGTLLDGILNLIAATLDDLITPIIFPVDANGDGVIDPLFRKWLGVAPAPPTVIFRDGQYSGIIESDRIQKKATARTVVIGGKSPAWLNQVQTFFIRWGLSQLGNAIMGFNVPGSVGLDNLYQGQLDDTLFAFRDYTDPYRVLAMGSHAFLEHSEDGSGTAWSVSGIMSMRAGLDKTRARTLCTVSVVNGFPWIVYDDFELGDRIGFELASVIFTEQCGGIKWSYSMSQALKCDLLLSACDDIDPFNRALRAIQGVWGVIGMILGDGGSTF